MLLKCPRKMFSKETHIILALALPEYVGIFLGRETPMPICTISCAKSTIETHKTGPTLPRTASQREDGFLVSVKHVVITRRRHNFRHKEQRGGSVLRD